MANPIASTSFTLGFHGCDRDVAERVLKGEANLRASANEYDWLGTGIYFWEHNPQRALEWADDLKRRGAIKGGPAVLGAIINLGNCLNLLDSSCIELVKRAYGDLVEVAHVAEKSMPQNQGGRRYLDYAVINRVIVSNPNFDTARGLFQEGDPIYPGAGIWNKSHIQICVKKDAAILGYFRPRK